MDTFIQQIINGLVLGSMLHDPRVQAAYLGE